MVRPRASSAAAAGHRTFEPLPDPRAFSDESSLLDKMAHIEEKITSMHARKVLSKLKPSTDRVLKSRNILNNIIHRYGGAIHKSWLGKNRAARIWQHLPDTQRAGIAYYQHKPKEHGLDESKRNHFLMPYMNTVDLSYSGTLLAFTHSRAYHHACEFARAETQNTGPLALNPNFVEQSPDAAGHVVVFRQPISQKPYAELIDLAQSPEAINHLEWGTAHRPSHAILVLESQEKILDFLNECCKGILPEAALQDINSSQELLPEPSSSPLDEGLFSSFQERIEAKYAGPQVSSWATLADYLQAQVQEQKSHILSLREDPA